MSMDQLSPVAPAVGSADWWEARYRSGDIPWDTGIVPPEVEALIASGRVPCGWALDLGCGSGLSSRYLARHGFRVIGVDLAQSALVRAHRAAQAAALPAFFCRGDVSQLGFLRVRATLALDIGCFHALPPDRRPFYVASLADLLVPGAFYLLYAFEPFLREGEMAPHGVGAADIGRFAPYFILRQAQHGRDGDRPSAWYLFRRSALPVSSPVVKPA
ncbi:MAG: methyltransferase domain-containing protein [Anaerolineae bacterium]|nr:methyltransferase domain-containing protein [Anaerolineae bacterium]